MEAEGTVMGCCAESMNKSFARQEPSKVHSSDAAAAAADSQPSATACFDCSICLDYAVDPVVTLCGHLYCWPCIYKWLQVQTTSPQQCPVCKSPISLNTLVPLYGRGSGKLTAKDKGLGIPNRPAVLGDTIAPVINERHSSPAGGDGYVGFNQPMQHHHHHHHYYPSPWGGMGVFSSTAGGLLGGLAIAILPLVFNRLGRGEMYLSRSNHLTTTGNSASPRERRVEASLHQIWAFLFCCAILCLLFF